MPAPSDRNALIALAKGWRYMVHDVQKQIVVRPTCPSLPPEHPGLAIWYDPQNRQSELPNFVDTLKGVSGMLFELFALRQGWQLGTGRLENGDLGWAMVRAGWGEVTEIYEDYMAPQDKLGDCVGDAYMSVKEVADASTEA